MTEGGRRLPVVGAGSQGPAPAFQRVAIVGLGAVGASLAAAVRRAWPQSLVIGVDTPDVVEIAMRIHAIDVGSGDLMIAGDADLVVLAGSADHNARVVPFLPEAIPGEAVVLALGDGDAVAERASDLPARLPLVTGLPAVALRGGGIQASSAALFEGSRWAVTPVTARADVVDRVHALVRAVGGDPSAV